MSDRDSTPESHRFDDVVHGAAGHPSQAEGEDPERESQAQDARPAGHPSQAEGDDDTPESADGLPETTDDDGLPVDNPSG